MGHYWEVGQWSFLIVQRLLSNQVTRLILDLTPKLFSLKVSRTKLAADHEAERAKDHAVQAVVVEEGREVGRGRAREAKADSEEVVLGRENVRGSGRGPVHARGTWAFCYLLLTCAIDFNKAGALRLIYFGDNGL